jgi:hypothetical protein
MNPLPVYLVLRGGLGNQLFMFASALSEVKKVNRKLQLISRWYLEQNWDSVQEANKRFLELNNFPRISAINSHLTNKFELFLYLIFKFAWKYGDKYAMFVCKNLDDETVSIGHIKPFIVHGYMQNPAVFALNRNELKSYLHLNDEVEEKVRNYIEALKTNGKRLIALHVRRGDTKKNYGPDYRLSLKHYERCLEQMNYDLHQVIVFSDEIDLCKKLFHDRDFHFVTETNPAVTLKMLSYCDDFILSVSTFSWWGAWLSDSQGKRVMFPNILDANSNWNNLAAGNWIKIEAEFEQE